MERSKIIKSDIKDLTQWQRDKVGYGRWVSLGCSDCLEGPCVLKVLDVHINYDDPPGCILRADKTCIPTWVLLKDRRD
jgi:hypothetical protein